MSRAPGHPYHQLSVRDRISADVRTYVIGVTGPILVPHMTRYRHEDFLNELRRGQYHGVLIDETGSPGLSTGVHLSTTLDYGANYSRP